MIVWFKEIKGIFPKILNSFNSVQVVHRISDSEVHFKPRVLEIVKLFEDRHQTDGKVTNYLDPSEVPSALGGLDISKCGITTNEASTLVENVWKHSIKTQHSHFYNALYHGVDTFGMAGGLLSEALNTNGYSHEVAPVFSAVEKSLIQYFGTKFGWKYVDGLTTPGGSISNM